MIKAVIFDMDGVMIDSEPIWFKVDNALIKKFGAPKDIDYRAKILGVTAKVAIKTLRSLFDLKGATSKIIKTRFKIVKKLFRERVKLNSGALQLFKNLNQEGYALAVASSAPIDIINIILTKFKIKKYFKVVVAGHNLKRSKPHPDIFLKAAKKLMIIPDNCLVIEDALSGELAAKRAGMKCIIVRHKYNQDIKFKLANKVVKSLKEINLKIIENL